MTGVPDAAPAAIDPRSTETRATGLRDPEPGPSGDTGFEPETYGASFLRTTMFCLVFLLLLPFFGSIPMMIGMRASSGLLMQNWGLLILAVAFAALMFLVLVEMIFSIRTRVHLGREKVSMTLPAGRGPTPMLRYASHEFPYGDVQSVETRREIYGGFAVPVMMRGARVTLKDGRVVPLGYVSEAEDDPVLPALEIAGKIAERARLPVIDRGSVRRSVRRKLMGLKALGTESDIVEDRDIEALNRTHSSFMFAVIGILLILMLIGIVEDFASATPFG